LQAELLSLLLNMGHASLCRPKVDKSKNFSSPFAACFLLSIMKFLGHVFKRTITSILLAKHENHLCYVYVRRLQCFSFALSIDSLNVCLIIE
jgi:hypothetical protein